MNAPAPTPAFSDGWSTSEPVDLDALDDDDPDPSAPAGAPAVDPEAPYGRFASGRPRKGPPGYRSASTKGAPRRRTPPAPRKTAAKKPAAAKRPQGPDYQAASMELVGIVQAVTGLAGTFTRSPAFRADTATLLIHGTELAQVSAGIAAEDARWASFLERATSVTKWSGPTTIALVIGLQVAVNHGLLPPGIMGTRPPQDVLQEADNIMAAQQEQMLAQMARAA